jgi:hypothetical protein
MAACPLTVGELDLKGCGEGSRCEAGFCCCGVVDDKVGGARVEQTKCAGCKVDIIIFEATRDAAVGDYGRAVEGGGVLDRWKGESESSGRERGGGW